jgi:fructose-1,6-bisphosphatase/inositol monophosphatase family enzyme
MIRINELKLPIECTKEDIKAAAAKTLGITQSSIGSISLIKKSVDCRHKNDIKFIYSVDCELLCNEEKIHVSNTSDIGYALLSTGFPYAKDDMNKNNLRQFNKFLPKIQCIRRLGSAALDLCYLACGRIDGYWEPMLHPWDTAAGSLIVTEAGGRVTKYNGDPFDPNFPEILASNGHIHNEMLKIINAQD